MSATFCCRATSAAPRETHLQRFRVGGVRERFGLRDALFLHQRMQRLTQAQGGLCGREPAQRAGADHVFEVTADYVGRGQAFPIGAGLRGADVGRFCGECRVGSKTSRERLVEAKWFGGTAGNGGAKDPGKCQGQQDTGFH